MLHALQVVAINQFANDTPAELEAVKKAATDAGGCGAASTVHVM
jgi:formyltetrahydrofolate synthetase